MREAVVLVHGLWSVAGVDLLRLRNRLNQAGYDCHMFNYHVWGKPPAEIAVKLNDFIKNIETPVVHIVAHSFGGIVTMHLFDQFPFNKRGRIVLLASPVNGSAIGKRISANTMTRWMLGQSIVNGLSGDVPEWKGWQDIGVIAGNIPIGMGLVAGGPRLPHDGTVSVEETMLKGATDSIIVRESHLSILMSASVARQVIIFLQTGLFDRETTTPLFDAEPA
ncbi:MAG: alpha/beta fold hydrolase [Gammaproteobacteria bacterium]|nr:alpha/beta fold hydrolase [Gammaproteobacteria bacterium]MBT8134461.1 alpha/beta fold hydrolase [Gammaproteobacteria bacterium]NNJ50187.1 alpha/beta hydrolase [Gammaproteobacteria bacterium]